MDLGAEPLGVRRRQCGQVVRMPDLKSGRPGFKSCSDRNLELFRGRPEINFLATVWIICFRIFEWCACKLACVARCIFTRNNIYITFLHFFTSAPGLPHEWKDCVISPKDKHNGTKSKFQKSFNYVQLFSAIEQNRIFSVSSIVELIQINRSKLFDLVQICSESNKTDKMHSEYTTNLGVLKQNGKLFTLYFNMER